MCRYYIRHASSASIHKFCHLDQPWTTTTAALSPPLDHSLCTTTTFVTPPCPKYPATMAVGFLTIFAALVALATAYLYFFGIPPELKRKLERQALKTMGENKMSYMTKGK